MPDCRLPDAALNAANFHMLPYSNRIRDGHFRFNGEDVQLDLGESHAIHGALRDKPWQVTNQTTDELTCEFDSNAHAAVNWPWPLHALVSYKLNGDSVRSRLELTNKGTTPMPAGMGWHPYFTRVIEGASPVLSLAVNGVYPNAAGDSLPDGAPITLPAELDFGQPRTLDPSQYIDCCYSGNHGNTNISWPGADLSIVLSASDNCTHLVFYNPDAPHFAIEPVTNANDAFNLANNGIDAGMRILHPDETLSAEMTLTLAK